MISNISSLVNGIEGIAVEIYSKEPRTTLLLISWVRLETKSTLKRRVFFLKEDSNLSFINKRGILLPL